MYDIKVIFDWLRSKNKKKGTRFTDRKFVVSLPKTISYLGFLNLVPSIAIMVACVLDNTANNHLAGICVIGVYILFAIYLIILPISKRVYINETKITVRSAFRKSYSFQFSDIATAECQLKNNRVKSERIVIVTTTGKRIIIENAYISYNRFLKRVMEEVPSDRLTGF